MKNGKQSFWDGRYGVDPISILALCVAALLLTFKYYLWIGSVLLIGYVVFRALSRHVDARRQELRAFTGLIQRGIMGFHRLTGRIWNRMVSSGPRWRERRDFVVFKCPKCKKKLRLPRRRGTLEVTCPVCGQVFRRKT